MRYFFLNSMGTSQFSQFCIIMYLILQDIEARIIYLKLKGGLWVPDTSHLTSIKYTWWDNDYIIVIYAFSTWHGSLFIKKNIYFYHQKIHVKPLSYTGSCDGAANIKKIVVTELNTFIDKWGRQIKRIIAELDKSYAENSKRVQNPKRCT